MRMCTVFTVRNDYRYTPPGANMDEEIIVKVGEHLRPIWNDGYVPEHHKEALIKADAPSYIWENDVHINTSVKHVMCIYGTKWLPVPKKLLREI